ncbi:MAG: cytochrome c1, partial [Gammaproteobacteria bacterium]|nr:cytochrome c1 [Gammaproteobacteria bacterium]
GCHSAKYARYERIATDLGIPVELYEENLIFNGAKPGELMNIAMSPALAKGWFGAPPPDLTLEARLRGPNWVYSYMRAFYADDSRPFGVNNVVFPSVGMPHVLVGLQGLCAEPPKVGVSGRVEPLSGTVVDQGGCQSWAIEGSMTPAEYDQAMFDLTNFLVYLGEPMQLERKRIGMYVLIFLAILFVFAYLLNREYWKDVH